MPKAKTANIPSKQEAENFHVLPKDNKADAASAASKYTAEDQSLRGEVGGAAANDGGTVTRLDPRHVIGKRPL